MRWLLPFVLACLWGGGDLHAQTSNTAPPSLPRPDAGIFIFKDLVGSCWTPPRGSPPDGRVVLLIRLKRDGTLLEPPVAERPADDQITQAFIESAVAAVTRCQPYDMLTPATYDLWKEISIDFVPDRPASESSHLNYYRAVVAHIQRFKRAPAGANARGAQGRAIMFTYVDSAGRVTYVRLNRTSGIASLDSEARELIRRASPLPAPPDGQPTALVLPINFK